jgi:hypothetical protein
MIVQSCLIQANTVPCTLVDTFIDVGPDTEDTPWLCALLRSPNLTFRLALKRHNSFAIPFALAKSLTVCLRPHDCVARDRSERLRVNGWCGLARSLMQNIHPL